MGAKMENNHRKIGIHVCYQHLGIIVEWSKLTLRLKFMEFIKCNTEFPRFNN